MTVRPIVHDTYYRNILSLLNIMSKQVVIMSYILFERTVCYHYAVSLFVYSRVYVNNIHCNNNIPI